VIARSPAEDDAGTRRPAAMIVRHHAAVDGKGMGVRVLVTGGAGFIGSHLVRRLAEQGDEVVVLDSLEPQVHSGATPTFPRGVTFIHGSVEDRACAEAALAGVESVVHLAAAVGVGQSMYEIERYVHVNTLATAAFLETLLATQPRPTRLVVASSMSIYGEGEYQCSEHGAVAPPPRREEQLLERRWECLCPICGLELDPRPTRETKPLIPTSVYAVTKRDHEELCLVVGAAHGVACVALRFFNVYGSGQALSNPYTGVAAIFSSRLLNGKPPLIFEDGRQSRDFIHVSDIVEGILKALESDVAVGGSFNLGTGRAVSIDEVAALLGSRLGAPAEPERPATYRSGDIRHCFADPTRAREQLGFTAEVRLEDGIDELVEWVRSQTASDLVDAATEELASRGLVR
jgi:dTDP-L-rhamnose 4-epimerase